MSFSRDALLALPDVALVLVALSVAAALGVGLGSIELRAIGLGIGSVLFAGIAVGHVATELDIAFDAYPLEFVREFGLVLCGYTLGVQVGHGFFASLHQSGLRLILLAVGVVGMRVGDRFVETQVTGDGPMWIA